MQIVLLCEDTQHEAFARRFLSENSWDTRRLRVEKAPGGRGAADQFVRERFPVELAAYRRKQASVAQALIVILDGDNHGIHARQAELDEACQSKGIEARQRDERVLVLVPTWNIETWIAYLDGIAVDEATPNYPRLARPRECRDHVRKLATMCQSGRLQLPAPSSLESACAEYARLADDHGTA